MTKCSVYIATSLDRHIARLDGSLDWLPGSDGSSEGGEDYGYHDFISSVDVLVMGRNTFEIILSFGSWHYGDLPIVVLTSRTLDLPDWVPDLVDVQTGTPEEIVAYLERRGYQHAYIDGGNVIQSFLRDGLIDELILTTIPVLIGRGIPLFGELTADIQLAHVGTTAYDSGIVQSHYQVARPTQSEQD